MGCGRPGAEGVARGAPRGEEGFGVFVGDEEEGGAGGGADDSRANASVDAGETAGGAEAEGGLETGFEGVEGVEGEVDCGAS